MDGDRIVTQKEKDSRLFIITYGEVSVRRLSTRGVETEIAHLFEGDVFGEAACLFEEPRNANIYAVGEVSTMILKRRGALSTLDEKILKSLVRLRGVNFFLFALPYCIFFLKRPSL